MEQHSVIGERILRKIDDYAEIAKVVRHHHERIDGQGYPDRLVGNEIPLLSRIIAVADAYNAMTSARPYRDPMPSRLARWRIAQAVGTQLDTSVVAAFEAVLTQASRTTVALTATALNSVKGSQSRRRRWWLCQLRARPVGSAAPQPRFAYLHQASAGCCSHEPSLSLRSGQGPALSVCWCAPLAATRIHLAPARSMPL